MAHLFSYWDESGKHDAHRGVVFNGLVDWPEPWTEFFKKWNELLCQYGLKYFRAVEALRFSQPYGNMKRCKTPDERAADLLPFVREMAKGIQFGFVTAVDVSAYRSADRALHKRFGPDPHLFAFYLAISEILKFFKVPPNLTIGLILDDEEKKSKLCYDLWTKLKMLEPDVRDRIISICFADDQSEPALQAADLFAYLSRLESERIFGNTRHMWGALWNELTATTGTERRLRFTGGFYDKKQITDHVIQQVLPLRQRLQWQSEST